MKYMVALVTLCAFISPSLAMNRATNSDAMIDSPIDAAVDECVDEAAAAEATKEKRVVFLYIANREAAEFYDKIVTVHGGKLGTWKRIEAKNHNASKFKKIMDETGALQILCKTIKKALEKCDAKQKLLQVNDAEGNSLIVAVTLQKPALVKKLVKRCKKSPYVYEIYSDGEEAQRALHYDIDRLKEKDREKFYKLLPYCKSDEKPMVTAANSHDDE